MFARFSIVMGILLGVAATTFGQVGTGFTISEGDVFFTQGNSATSGTTTFPPSADFRVNGAASTDHLFRNWWWYRVEGVDTREIAFNNATGTVAAGDNATTNWIFPNFTASLAYNVNDTGVLTGEVLETMVVTNTSAAPITLQLFNFSDFDLNGNASGDSATGGLTGMNMTEGATAARFEATSHIRYQASFTAFAIENLFTNASVDNLGNVGLPGGPGDFSGAFQWQLSLQPGVPTTISERLAIVPEPSSLALVALGAIGLIRRRR